MRRRSFLKLTGGAFASALFSGEAAIEESALAETEGGGVLIDSEKLRGRNQNRSTLVCRNGLVCASQPLAAMAGVDILKAGGNAIDAAVCTNAMLSVVEPMSCGPGGDLFAIVWIEKDKKLYGLNASGRSPYNWSLESANKLGLKSIGSHSPLSWSVPGCVSGWSALLEKFGKFGMGKVLEAAIDSATGGFAVTPIISGKWWRPDGKFKNLTRTFTPGGKRPEFGDLFKNPDMANFLKKITKGGADIFYKGEIAERIVNYSRAKGGRFSMRDFHDHTVTWVEPVSANYRGYDVWELPPNGQGIAALQMFNLLEHFDIASMRPNSAEQLHLFIEAKKLAFEDRAVYYADMNFAEVPLKQLISKEYARERLKLIDPKRAAQKVSAGRLRSSSDTVYLTAADKQGNMVSLIQSIYFGWGSRLVPDGLGFCLQNRGKLFSLNPKDLNRLEPHKRPFHTIIPAFVTRRAKPVFSFGVMGGDFQPQGHAQVLMNLIDFGLSVQQAGEQPRVSHSESSKPTGERSTGPGTVTFERHIDESVKRKLAEMGHKINKNTRAFGGYQGIWRKDNPLRYFGGSDPRKDGCAIGY